MSKVVEHWLSCRNSMERALAAAAKKRILLRQTITASHSAVRAAAAALSTGARVSVHTASQLSCNACGIFSDLKTRHTCSSFAPFDCYRATVVTVQLSGRVQHSKHSAVCATLSYRRRAHV